MRDNEENPPSLLNPSVQEVESTMEDKTLGKVELGGSGLEDVPNLDDLRFVDTHPEVPVVVKKEEVERVAPGEGNVVVEGGDVADGEVEIVIRADALSIAGVVLKDEYAETVREETALSGSLEIGDVEEKGKPVADDLQVGGVELADVVKNDDEEKAASEEGNAGVEGGDARFGKEKSFPGADDSPVGGNEFVVVMQVDEAEMMPDEGNHEVEGGEVGEGLEKSVPGADGIPGEDAQLTAVMKENDDDTPVGSTELVAIVKEDNVAMSKCENLKPGTEMRMEGNQAREAVVNEGAEASPESHVAELADLGPLDIMDDAKVGEAVKEMGVEAGASAGENDIAKVADDVVKATAEYEIPKDETQTEMEPEVEPEPAADVNIVATDSEAFKDDEIEREESGGSDDPGANVNEASEPEAEDYMEVQTKSKGIEDGSLPDVNYSKQPGDLSPIVTNEDEEDAPLAEKTQTVDPEMETETEMESGKDIRGKRKRAKNSKVLSTRAPSRKTLGEDVCFICFYGGDLVLCDRRGCSKAYHPSCVNRDEAFFRAKGKWNCG